MNYIEQALKAVEQLVSPEEPENEGNEINEIRVRSLGYTNALSIAAKTPREEIRSALRIFESGTLDDGANRLYAQLASDYREILAAKEQLIEERAA